MKSNYFLSAIAVVALTLPLSGQDQSSKPVRNIAIQNVDLQLGFLTLSNHYGSLEDFKRLAPASVLLSRDLSSYSQLEVLHTATAGMFNVAVGFHFGNKKISEYRQNPILTIGVNYYKSSIITRSMKLETRLPYDTLLSNQTGQSYYIDSVNTKNYDMEYSSEQLRLDAALIFRTNPQARVSVFTGFGINGGISIASRTDISYHEDYHFKTGNELLFSYSGGVNCIDNSYESETFANEGNYDIFVYVPIGGDMRLAKKNRFWRKMHLLVELKPGITYSTIPELGSNASGNLQVEIGIRSTVD